MNVELPLLEWQRPKRGAAADALHEEWLATNGLGGYASGTLAMCNTRRYHGLFVPSLAHFGRTVMLGRLDDSVLLDGKEHRLGGVELPGEAPHLPALEWIARFTLRGLIPEWELSVGPVRLRKSVVMVNNESTVYVVYQHVGGPAVGLRLRPYPMFRPHDLTPHDDPAALHVQLAPDGVAVTVHPDVPALKLKVQSHCKQPFVLSPERSRPMLYRVEVARGFSNTEIQLSPGWFECTLEPQRALAFCATLHDWETLSRHPEEVLQWEADRELKLLERCGPKARDPVACRLALAADQFIIAPKHRPPDTSWAHSTGQDLRSVIAGYHWFTDWGRDTMISLEGLTLCTGRTREAAAILRTFVHHVRDGLVPNYFPEGEQRGVYHTADATLWFFHAIERYLRRTRDVALLKDLWPCLVQIVEHHLAGTRFGIRVDADGLLGQGAPGFQLTWMDAKVDDWVVTPRRGKAVELQALWFNALELMKEWAVELGHDPQPYARHAEKTSASFNARFWNEAEGCLYDVVDSERGDDDASIRPNQIFAISLTHPVLDPSRWSSVMSVVRRELLTPVGLRTLSPRHPDFKETYDGDLRARDAAYHQGTVWPWLLAHYVDAVLKTSNGDTGEAMAVLQGLVNHLEHAGVGNISEIFDAMPPYHPRGCIAQAWSVAETLRVWVEVAALRAGG